ncbi:MAG: serine hydrolase domain-containing protein, partial [Rhodothermales bacterium]
MHTLFSIALLGVCLLAACSSHPITDQERLAQIFSDYIGDDTPGAAVLVIHDGAKVLKGTYGMANLERNEPVRSSTNFRLASMTKQFTAMS